MAKAMEEHILKGVWPELDYDNEYMQQVKILKIL